MYPAFVFGTTYAITLSSGLPGGRHGPQDAYRHCLASAIVAYTLSPRCVEWVTERMEGRELRGSHAMDAHNNGVGARLGERANGWSDLLRSVRAAVAAGSLLAEPGQGMPTGPVWLAEELWSDLWW